MPFKFNEDEYPHVMALGEKMGCEVIVNWPSHATKFKSSKKLEPADREKMLKMFDDRISRVNFWIGWLRAYFVDHAVNQKRMPCVAGKMFAHVSPNGLVKPCAMLEDDWAFGEVGNNGLSISGRKLKEQIKRIPNECQWVGDKICCDYLNSYSAAKMPWYLLVWKVRNLLGLKPKGV